MSQGVSIVIETNQWAKLAEEMVRDGIGKDYISAELKSMLGKIATKGKPIIRKYTPVRTGFLYASIGSRSDRTKDRLAAWGLVGYLRPSMNKHQFWVTLGTKGRHTKKGAYRGMMKPAKPDPFKETEQQLKGPAQDVFAKNMDLAITRGAKKMDKKYGTAWRQL